jgi:hypothetical protein
MPEPAPYDYAIIRVVPQVDREEFVNVGVILCCPAHGFVEACIEMNDNRVLALDPEIDLEAVKSHLSAIPAVCRGGSEAGPIGLLPKRERFLMLVAPRSTMIQPSAVHTGVCMDPAATMSHLMDRMVRPPRSRKQ